MPTKLTDLEIEEVSCVDAGANPHAAIVLAKRAEPITKEELGTEVAAKSGKGDPLDKTEPTVEQLQAELKKAIEGLAAVEELRKRASDTETELTKVKAEAKAESEKREALEKRNEELAKAAKEERDARLLVQFEKRADDKIPSLPGETKLKGRLLKAIDENLPEEDAKEIMKLLESGNAAMQAGFIPTGISGSASDGSALAKLEGLAKARAKEKSISFSKAMAQVQIEERELYQEAQSERARRAN